MAASHALRFPLSCRRVARTHADLVDHELPIGQQREPAAPANDTASLRCRIPRGSGDRNRDGHRGVPGAMVGIDAYVAGA